MLTAQLIPREKIPRPSNRGAGNCCPGSRKLLAETKTDAAQTAVVIVDAGQRGRSASVHTCALLDDFTMYQVVGSVVDYQAGDAYGGSGFDSGEGA